MFQYNNTTIASTMSARLYVVLLSIFTSIGLAISGFTAILTYNVEPNWLFVLGFMILSFIGVFVAKVDDTVISFIGYLMIAIGLGAITGPYVALYTAASVVQIFFLTMAVTLMIGFWGAIAPFSVSHWGGFLLVGLWILLFAQFGTLFLAMVGVNVQITMTILDWLAVFLFSFYIFYDMNQAMRKEYSVRNAMHYAVHMYLNVMNVFIRLLSLLGVKSDD